MMGRMAAPVMACRINSAWLMLQAESRWANSAYSSSVMRVLTTRLRCGVLYRFRMVKPPFCAWCPLTNRRKTGCEAELFLKNPKKYFEGFLSGASRISRVWGRHSPTRFPQGQNERKANFGTAVESCSKKVAAFPVWAFADTLDGEGGASANFAAVFLPLIPTTPRKAKLTEICENFFLSPFSRHNTDDF